MDRSAKRPRPNRDAFVLAYAAHGIGERAAIEAGYDPHSARRQASRLLSNDHIRQRVQDERDAISHAARLTVARTLREEMLIAFSDIGDYVDENDNPLRLRSITPNKRRAIRKLKRTTTTRTDSDGNETMTTVVELELWGKIEALRLLHEHQGLSLSKTDLDAIRKRQDELDARLPRKRDETPSEN